MYDLTVSQPMVDLDLTGIDKRIVNVKKEHQLIGLILKNPAIFPDVYARLNSDCFTDIFCHLVYKAFTIIHTGQMGADEANIDNVGDSGRDENVITDFIMKIVSRHDDYKTAITRKDIEGAIQAYKVVAPKVATNALYYVRDLNNTATRIRLWYAGKLIEKLACDQNADNTEMLSQSFELLRAPLNVNPTHTTDMTKISQEYLNSKIDRTPIETYNPFIPTLGRGEVVALMGESSTGKSAFTANLILNTAMQMKKLDPFGEKPEVVVFISYEMSALDIMDIFVSILTGVEDEILRDKNIPSHIQAMKEKAVLYISSLPMVLLGRREMPKADWFEIRQHLDLLVNAGKRPEIVAVDGLWMMSDEVSGQARQVFELRRVSSAFNNCIWLLAQSREIEGFNYGDRMKQSHVFGNNTVAKDFDRMYGLSRDKNNQSLPTFLWDVKVRRGTERQNATQMRFDPKANRYLTMTETGGGIMQDELTTRPKRRTAPAVDTDGVITSNTPIQELFELPTAQPQLPRPAKVETLPPEPVTVERLPDGQIKF